MEVKKILSIGFPYENDLVESVEDFLSNASFLDYEIVLWTPDGESLKGRLDSNGYKVLDQLDSIRLVSAVSNRYAEMQSFLNLGRTVIIHNSEPELYYCSSISQYRKLLDAVPLSSEALEMVVSTGKNIEFRGDEPFATFWRKNQQYFKYKAYFKQSAGIPLFFINKTSYVVGCYLKVGDGNLIFLPSVGSIPELNLKPNFDKDFIDSIAVLVEELQKKADDIELPIWSRHYSLPDEHDRRKNVLNLEEDLIKARQKILEEQELIVEIERNKILFVGTGKSLEIQVKKSLKN